jgi:hypothetical protein
MISRTDSRGRPGPCDSSGRAYKYTSVEASYNYGISSSLAKRVLVRYDDNYTTDEHVYINKYYILTRFKAIIFLSCIFLYILQFTS